MKVFLACLASALLVAASAETRITMTTTPEEDMVDATPQQLSFAKTVRSVGIPYGRLFTLMAVPKHEHFAVIASPRSANQIILAFLYQNEDGTVTALDKTTITSKRLGSKPLTLQVYTPRRGVSVVCVAKYWYCEVHLQAEKIVCEMF